MFELLKRISNHLEFLMDCTIEPSSVRMQTQKLIDEIQSHIEAPKSNADRIRQMTDEELAEFLDNNGIDCDMCNKHPAQCDHECYCGIVEFLKSEVSEDAGTD